MPPLQSRKGAPAPLLDRLCDDDPGVAAEPVPRRYLDLDGLAGSVRREIGTLLNSRCGLTEDEIDYETRSVADFGLIDLSHLFTDNPRDRERLARHVARTIAAYEPRLIRVHVTVEALRRQTGTLDLRIDGGLRFGETVEPISFPLRVDGTAAPDES
jgi:type VI secretion system protein ImpF